jgi:hypothetical protein
MIWIVLLAIAVSVVTTLVIRARRETSLDDVRDAEAARNVGAQHIDPGHPGGSGAPGRLR